MRQHRCQAETAFLWHPTGHDPVQPGARTRARDLVFPKVLNLIDSNGLSDGLHFTRGGIKRIGTAERRGLEGGFIALGEIVGHLKPELCAPDGTHACKNVVHRCGAIGPCRRQLFVGVRHGKPFLIVLDDLGQGVSGRDPGAKAGHIHRHRVAFGFAFDHPLRQHKANAATLAEAGHDAASRPVIAHSGDRADQRIAIGGKGKGAVDHVLDAGALQIRKPFVSEINALLYLVKVIGQQCLAKVPAGAANSPGAAGLLVKSDTQAFALLTQVAFARRVHHVWVFVPVLHHLDDQRNLFGHDVLVFHRMQGKVNSGHCTHFPRPQTTRIHDVFRVDRALVRDDVPGAVGALVGLAHHALRFDRGPTHASRFCIGVGGPRRVEMPIQRVIQPADDAIDICDRRDLLDLLGTDDFGIKPHEAVFGPFGQHHVEPVPIVGQCNATDMVQPAGHAGDLFQLLVKPDRIPLQSGHVGIAVQCVKSAGGMPSGARCKLRALQQHHVRPSQFGEVIQNGASDDASADDCNAGSGFHGGLRV